MAGEIIVSQNLQITNNNFKVPKIGSTNQPADQAAPGGGVPGRVLVTNAAGGILIDLSTITKGGFVVVLNTDAANYVTLGVDNGGAFLPWGEVLPGEFEVYRLSRTGTLRLLAPVAGPVECLVAVYNK